MNISQDNLMNNNFSNGKIQFYSKIGNKYYHSLLKYNKKHTNYKDFKKNVINWLFSYDEETRMILCSIENKKYTDIIKRAFNIREQCSSASIPKFYLKDNAKVNIFELLHINNPKINIPHDYVSKERSLLNDLKFYQCESPINDYNKYTNYFTFFDILKNDYTFINVCTYFANEKFLETPLEVSKDSNKYIDLPEWIYDDNAYQNAELVSCYQTSININLYYSLPKLILALLEQVLCVRYLIYYDTNNLEDILSSIYLHALIQKRNDIIKYITPKEKKFSYLYFKIDELAKNLYNDIELKLFVDKNEIKDGSIFEIDIEKYFNKDDDLNNIILEGNNFFNKFLRNNTQKDFIDFFLFFNIKKLFTYDDFYFRGIFEKIYETLLNQNIKDLIFDDEKEKEKKKKKKKKKKNEKKESTKLNNEIINENQNDKNKQLDFGDEVLKILSDSNLKQNIEENQTNKETNKEINIKIEIQEDNKNNENKINLINDDEKDLINKENIIFKNEKKQKKNFFLYDATNKNTKKKNNKQNQENEKKINKIEKIEKKNEQNNINIQIHQNSEPIPSHTNSLSFISSKNEKDIQENKINNEINQETISLSNEENKSKSPDGFEHLHNSIEEYYNILEEALVIQRKIKNELFNYFSSIIKIVYKNTNILIYGSSLYNLDIDTSDLDLSISSKEDINLSDLELYLKENNNNNQYISVNGIFTASVPVIKIEIDYLKLENDEITRLYKILKDTVYYKKCYNSADNDYMNKTNIDISLNSINNKQIEFIKDSLNEYPEMRPIIKILKKILQLKNMNNSYHGGMSSYCLFLLIFSYMKFYHNKINVNKIKEINLGSLLIEILTFYTNYIDFNCTIIDPSSNFPFIREYTLDIIPTIIEPITKKNAAKTIYKIFDVMESLRIVNEDLLRILQTDSKNNSILELMKEYSNN